MSDWLAILDRLDRLMSEHMAWEEENLFPLLLSGLPEAAALIGGLCEDHRELAGLLRALRQQSIAGSEPGRIQQLGVLSRDLIDLMRFHREREDRAAWPMAVRLLDRQDWDRLMAALPTST